MDGTGAVLSSHQTTQALPNGVQHLAPRARSLLASTSRNTAQASLDASEVYFLLLHFLSEGPCQAAARTLEDEAVKHGLLPQRHGVHGKDWPYVCCLCWAVLWQTVTVSLEPR